MLLFNLKFFYMKRIALLLMFFAIGLNVLWAQTREIRGTVTSADDGSSLPGVSVSVKGTTLGTITDMDGAFRLKVPQDAKSLIFSFVGMVNQEVAINNQSTINVKMASQNIGFLIPSIFLAANLRCCRGNLDWLFSLVADVFAK